MPRQQQPLPTSSSATMFGVAKTAADAERYFAEVLREESKRLASDEVAEIQMLQVKCKNLTAAPSGLCASLLTSLASDCSAWQAKRPGVIAARVKTLCDLAEARSPASSLHDDNNAHRGQILPQVTYPETQHVAPPVATPLTTVSSRTRFRRPRKESAPTACIDCDEQHSAEPEPRGGFRAAVRKLLSSRDRLSIEEVEEVVKSVRGYFNKLLRRGTPDTDEEPDIQFLLNLSAEVYMACVRASRARKVADDIHILAAECSKWMRGRLGPMPSDLKDLCDVSRKLASEGHELNPDTLMPSVRDDVLATLQDAIVHFERILKKRNSHNRMYDVSDLRLRCQEVRRTAERDERLSKTASKLRRLAEECGEWESQRGGATPPAILRIFDLNACLAEATA